MKAIFIAFNEAWKDTIIELLGKCNLKGYTCWEQISGRGSVSGEPHLGSHAWPTMNTAMMVIANEKAADDLKKGLKEIDDSAPELGLRFFTWSVD